MFNDFISATTSYDIMKEKQRELLEQSLRDVRKHKLSK